jgi:hypothetical protein
MTDTPNVVFRFKEVFVREPKPNPLPDDFEECGDCGFDHDYEYELAAAWHIEHLDSIIDGR